jgi:putative endonuclease
MLNSRQRFGKIGESLAVKKLISSGYSILEKNFRAKPGEVDIIAKDKDSIVFVEVKSRKTKRYGNAKYSITSTKQRKISMAALAYLKQKKMMNKKARFDVVIIHPDKTNHEIELIKNAFELNYG